MEAEVERLLSRLSLALAEDDAVAARRRLAELRGRLGGADRDVLRQVRAELSALTGQAEALQQRLAGALQGRRQQRRQVGVYRSIQAS